MSDHKHRLTAILAAAAVVLTACSSAPPDQSAGEGRDREGAASNDASAEGGGANDKKKKGNARGDRGKRGGKGKNEQREAGGGTRKSAGDGGGNATEPGGERASRGGTGGASAAPYPAAGTYSFAQSGYEEYCQRSSCDRKDLPARQPISVAHRSATRDSAQIVMEVRASRSRVARSTARFGPRGALVTKVYVRNEYQGFVFEETYNPNPPVETLRFPLRVGSSWSGRWEDSTSGRYSIRITERERVQIGSGTVDAFKFVTDMEFSGELNGKSRVVSWIDPSTKTIVRTDGVLNVTSAFGRYSTAFETVLSSGPGYG